MRFKLDENLGRAAQASLTSAGHDVETVYSQQLAGKPDSEVIGVCHGEGRCLITLDVEFGNPMIYPPSRYSGIVVLRVRDRSAGQDLALALATLVRALEKASPARKLWLVQHDRVREYQDPGVQ